MVSVSITRSDVGENIARRTAEAYRALPAAQRDRTVIIGESYIVAAFLDGGAPKYHLPTSYSTSRSYGYFPPPPADHDVVLYVGRQPDRLRPYFNDARTRRRHRRGHARLRPHRPGRAVGNPVAPAEDVDGLLISAPLPRVLW